jgi:asparagine synthetase B (glutamine-hydrolysing)
MGERINYSWMHGLRENLCRLRHRGPDWSGLFVNEEAGCYLSHERLAIIDPTSGDQPLYNASKNIVVAVSTASELLPLQVDTKMMMIIA